MFKNIIVLLSLVFSFSLFAKEKMRHRLATASYINQNLKSCYRWLSSAEKIQWLKSGLPYLGPIKEGDSVHLGRGGKLNKGIYCWSNPVGAIRGGSSEKYGEELVRIDFVEDAVIWDRNINVYYSINNSFIPKSAQKGVDTEIFYANYKTNLGSRWFQEYIIKNPNVIKGFSFSDQKLRESFNLWYNDLMSGFVSLEDTHFYFSSYCPFKSQESDGDWDVFQKNSNRWYCYQTRQFAQANKDHLEKLWENDPTGEYTIHSNQRILFK